MKKIRYVAMALAALFGITAALAQVISVPLITLSYPFQDLIQVIPQGVPSAQSKYEPWAGVTNVYGYYLNGTGNGSLTLNTTANTSFVQFANASAIANLYLYLPTAPLDGARNCYFSIGGVTAMTEYAGVTTDTLNNAITAMTALTQYCYLYSKANTAWNRD